MPPTIISYFLLVLIDKMALGITLMYIFKLALYFQLHLNICVFMVILHSCALHKVIVVFGHIILEFIDNIVSKSNQSRAHNLVWENQPNKSSLATVMDLSMNTSIRWSHCNPMKFLLELLNFNGRLGLPLSNFPLGKKPYLKE